MKPSKKVQPFLRPRKATGGSITLTIAGLPRYKGSVTVMPRQLGFLFVVLAVINNGVRTEDLRE